MDIFTIWLFDLVCNFWSYNCGCITHTVCDIHMGEAHCCCVAASCGVCVGCGSSETWRQNSDALTHVCICTLTHSHALFGGMINRGISGSFRRGSEKPFQLQTDFLSLPMGSVVVIITGFILVYHFFITAAMASSSHFLMSLRWQRRCSSLVDTVTNPAFPQSALPESSVDPVKRFPRLTLLFAASLCFHSQGLNNCSWAA